MLLGNFWVKFGGGPPHLLVCVQPQLWDAYVSICYSWSRRWIGTHLQTRQWYHGAEVQLTVPIKTQIIYHVVTRVPLLSIIIDFLTFSGSSSLEKWPGPDPKSTIVLKLRLMSWNQ